MHTDYPNYTRHDSGFYFHNETPTPVADAIARAYRSGQRVRLFQGDIATGVAWPEENDVLGTIGASTGTKRTALLIHNARSMGGGAILTHCVVGIQSAPGRFIYRHPQFSVGNWTTGESVTDGYASAAFHNGELHAQFRKSDGATRYCAFMRGERWSK